MSKRALLLLLLALVPWAGCSPRCAGPSSPDAGVTVHRAIDLRSAYMVMFPEYRGLRVLSSKATLTRVLRGPLKDLHAALDAPLQSKGFALQSEGADFLARRAPFVFEARATPDGAQLAVWLPISEDEVNKTMMAPASLSSESMALWFPAVSGTTIAHEDYELQLTWLASYPERPWFIIRQLVDGAIAAGWKPRDPLPYAAAQKLPDGGAAPLPDPLDLELSEPNSGTRLAVHREGMQVTVRYLLRTIDPAGS